MTEQGISDAMLAAFRMVARDNLHPYGASEGAAECGLRRVPLN